MWVHYGRVGRMVVMEEHRRKGSWTAKQRERIPLTSRCWRKRLRYHLGPRAAGVGGRAVIRASGTRVPPLPRPRTRNLEDVRGVETTEKLA